MNLPDFINVENIVAIGTAAAGWLGIGAAKKKMEATKAKVDAMALALARAYRAIPEKLRPTMAELFKNQVGDKFSSSVAKRVVAKATEIVIERNLHAMADAAAATAVAFEKLPDDR